MERYACIHGHFYQPPRENPWLEAIELQDSAYPYHDWNERVTVECYAPNAASRILDEENRIREIVNNYAKISFNIGPTLIAWMEHNVPDVYQMILAADRESQARFSGHGSALAQCYNHMIMPLANYRDKHSQVHWGIRDFEHRFARQPEGMWLPETAVDLETLDALAAHGIRFTILAQYQAQRVRKIGARTWTDVLGGHLDPSRPYEVRLPSGRRIAVFFYDGPISRAVAFEGMLDDGQRFAQRILDGFTEARTWPQIVNLATDGESYGHHHRFGDMALSYALSQLEASPEVKLTNYGEFLERFPPTHEVEIVENTAWSCAHGIDRWRSDCGCNSGGHAGWNQAWRAPLRGALDWLRDTLAPQYERRLSEILEDPWAARDDYVDVVLDRSADSIDQFLAKHTTRDLNAPEKIVARQLLELQRHLMLMYTSCGWFFDEISGLETVQILQYAGRAVQLAQDLFGNHLEDEFITHLAEAKSNLPENGDGARIYEKFVKPSRVDLTKVGAHYAVSSLFESYAPSANVYCYTVDRKYYRVLRSGRAKVAVGRAKVTSQVTGESETVSFGVLHFGDHNILGGVREFRGQEAYQTLLKDIYDAFTRADLPQIIRLLDQQFGGMTYSLRSLFRDEQRRILEPIVAATLAEAEAEHRQIYEHHAPLMRFLTDLGTPLPKVFATAAEVVLNADLQRALRSDYLDLNAISSLLAEAKSWNVDIDSAGIGYSLKRVLGRMIDRLQANPSDEALLRRLEALAEVIRSSHLHVDLWKTQNVYCEMLRSVYPEYHDRAKNGDDEAHAWADRFAFLGEKLGVQVPQ